MLKQNKLNWAQETVFIRDEAGQVLAEFDMDIDQSGTKWWAMQRYNYNLFGKNIAADITGEDIEQTRAIDIATSRRYYFHDHLGSVRVIANQYGEPVYNFEYWPFGEEFTSSEYNEGTYRYTGQERDYDLDLDYMMSRHYSWKYGRFLQPDPVNGSIGNAQSWNLYSYVENDPMNYIDPYGLLQVQVEAGTPLNLEYAIKDINAWEMFQHMQILLMFQKNELIYYINTSTREIGSVVVCTDLGCMENVYVQVPDAKVPIYDINVEGSFADWWSKFKSGYYWGTGYGQYSLNYYADIIADPKSTFAEQAGAVFGGIGSALWTPETYWQTYLGLTGIAGVDAAISRQGLRIFGKFITKVNVSKHTGNIAIRIPLKKDIYIKNSQRLSKILFKKLF